MSPEPRPSRHSSMFRCTHRVGMFRCRAQITSRSIRSIAVACAATIVATGCATRPDSLILRIDGVSTTAVPNHTVSSKNMSSHSAPLASSLQDDLSAAPNGDPMSPGDAFEVLVQRRVACLTTPHRCDVSLFTAPGTSEARRMGDTVARFRRDGLRLSPRRGRLELTVNSVTLDPVNGSVIVDSCERDSHVLVDARFTELGEIIIDESVVTTRARWQLVDTDAAGATSRPRSPRWRIERVDIVTQRHGGVPCSQL